MRPHLLDTARVVLLGLAEQDIPVIVRSGFLKPLGNPPPTAIKNFSAVQVLELAGEAAMLNKIRNAVHANWRGKNATYSTPRHGRDGHAR